MRKFKMGLIALTASAALMIPAANAAASTQSVSNTASSSSAGCVLLCFDLYVDDVLSGNDVDIITATVFCNNISLVGVLVGQWVSCGDGHKKVKRTH
ncbi:MAG: hypothetical protein ACRDLN_12145 [Solirubrobacteraceae bacterium]